MLSHDQIKANIKKRLDYLDASKYRAAVSNGMDACWFAAVLNENRYQKKVSTVVIDEAANALGVPAHELLNPYFEPDRWPPPAWAIEHLGTCPTCGRLQFREVDADSAERTPGTPEGLV